ncbi:hypothetical protein EAF04_008591 [Stromatinia cepivora]|nr:hypothetical protein EAF04_008591 [Stromatinia cepivora]
MRTGAVAALAASTANAAALADVCTVSDVQAALPANGTLNGINPIASLVTANAVYNATIRSVGVAFNYCNVTVTYTHPGKDSVVVWYNFPGPESYKNRFYVAGGGGYSLNVDPTGGLRYGAVGGVSDAGYAAISGTSADEVVLTGNGSINWDSIYMFSYQALGEMTQLGKAITLLFYGNNSSKLYTYYEGCSDGGREGMSPIQRYGSEYDGAITGAPAFRYGQQQNHLFSNVAEVMMDYFPPPCEMEKIVNMTIAACDPLDGRTDGVVSRTDLCKMHFNLNSTIGAAYSCEASTSSSLGFAFGQKAKRQMGMPTANTPAQNGTVTAQGAALAAQLYDGMFNSKGERVYLPWQPASSFQDATTSYDNTTDTWGVDITSTGVRYIDSLQTTVPDISEFQSSGGKLIHYHGESDDSVPPCSSVRYYDSVRSIMYPNQSFNESITSLKEWYKLFLIPGAAHCSTNTLQPGPYPADNMATMIDWVENGIKPKGLNATVSSGTYKREVQKLCSFPLRPIWDSEGTLSCEYDQTSVDSWIYTLDAFKVPVY